MLSQVPTPQRRRASRRYAAANALRSHRGSGRGTMEKESRARTTRQPPAQPTREDDDEISLFDLWDILARRRWTIVATIALALALSGVYVAVKPDSYRYWSAIEIGTRVVDGAVRPLQSPRTVVAKLQEDYVPDAIGRWRDANPDTDWRPELRVRTPDDSQIVVLEGEASLEREEAVESMMRSAYERLQVDHEHLLVGLRRSLRLAIEQAENALLSARNEHGSLQTRIERLQDREATVRDEVRQVEELLADSRERMANADMGTDGQVQALTLLMLNNEMRETSRYLSNLRRELRSELPAQREELRNEVRELRQIIEERRREVEAKEQTLASLEGTRMLSEPRRSSEPRGVGGGTIMALAGILGIMAGVMMAFLSEFVARAREHAQVRGRARDSGDNTAVNQAA